MKFEVGDKVRVIWNPVNEHTYSIPDEVRYAAAGHTYTVKEVHRDGDCRLTGTGKPGQLLYWWRPYMLAKIDSTIKVGDLVRIRYRDGMNTLGIGENILAECAGTVRRIRKVTTAPIENYASYLLEGDDGAATMVWPFWLIEKVEEKSMCAPYQYPIRKDQIVITRSGGDVVIAEYSEDGVHTRNASAKCAPSDTFDFLTRAKLALERLAEPPKPVFTLEGFKNGEFAVHCKTEESAKKFLTYLHNTGIKWRAGESCADFTYYYDYGPTTCYRVNGGLGFCEREFYEREGSPIIDAPDFPVTFNLEDFKAEKLVVHCPTRDEAKKFLKYLHSQGLVWKDGDRLLDEDGWGVYKEETCYRNRAEGVSREDRKYAKSQGTPIVAPPQFPVEFNLEDFKAHKIAVHCKTEAEAKRFLLYCHQQGMKWRAGQSCAELTEWLEYEADTCYHCYTTELCYDDNAYVCMRGLTMVSPPDDLPIKFDFDTFMAEDMSVQCKTEDEAKIFLAYLHGKGLKWLSDESLLTWITTSIWRTFPLSISEGKVGWGTSGVCIDLKLAEL